MTFFRRLFDLIRGTANSALDKLENPEQSLDLAIKDASAEVDDFRKQVARALVDQKKLAAELERSARVCEEWGQRAEQAVLSGDDDLAREALGRRTAEESAARDKYQALQQQTSMLTRLKDELRELTLKLDDAKRKRNLLVARSKNAKARKKMADALHGSGGSFQRFDELEAKVVQLEFEADATVEMARELESGSDGALERRFKALPTRNASVEASLLELKSRLKEGAGRLPAGAPNLLGPGGSRGSK